MTQNITTGTGQATFSHRTMSRKAFRVYITQVYGWRGKRGLTLTANYKHVEYMSAPDGLIVLAHHDTIAGQVDGIHPVANSKHIEHWANIIEPLTSDCDHVVHYMTRKSQGGLMLGAFGRMIQPGDPEAKAFQRDSGRFVIELFNGPKGPIVAIIENADTVHLIERDMVSVEMGKAA